VLAGGKLTLDRDLCRTDLHALEAAFQSAERLRDADPASLKAAARSVLEHYPGPLLGSEDQPWIAKPRDALRARFVRCVQKLGEALERDGEAATAIDLYRQGLQADNLAEPLYRGLMRALAATGDQAEALNTFRRCRELLSVVLGLQPSAETQALHRAIVAGRAAGRPAASHS
jgi:DNA-binding SARP family transcriptional activator